MNPILVFRETILPLSETFIKEQADALIRYAPVYCGFQAAVSSLIPAREAVLLRSDQTSVSKLRLIAYQKLHYAGFLRSLLEHRRPRLLHAHFAPDGLSALPLVRSLKIPLIVTLHGYDVTKDTGMQPDYTALWKEASLFLCVSQFIRTCALNRGFPADKLRVHYVGVDEQRFSAPEPLLPSELERNVLFIGRLVQKKGCAYLIDAMQQVQAKLPDVKLTIIGDGPLRPSLEQRAREAKVSASFLGAQTAQQIRQSLTTATVFCTPSVAGEDGDSEGFGMVFIEAQSMRVPVVSFRHGGIPEAVKDGSTGLLAEEGDTDGLVKRLMMFLENSNERKLFGEAARKRVQDEFSLVERTRELEVIYDAVIANATTCV